MPGLSAREMLSKLPLRMANGGSINLSEESAYEQSQAYNRALESGGEEGVQAYYANLRNLADKYMAGTLFEGEQPVGADAYNEMLKAGISNTDLINAGVGPEVLNKIFTTATSDPTFTTPTDIESAYMTNPTLAAEAARRTAAGQDGVASLQQQARDYVAEIKKDGITPEELSLMREIALEGGYTLDDIKAAGIDPAILFNVPSATPTTPTTKVCPAGTLKEGQTIPIGDDCGVKTTPTTKVCPSGTLRQGETIPIAGDCDQLVVTDGTTKVCPPGTLKAGQTIPIADDCGTISTETTKLCPEGTTKAGQRIPIADDCGTPFPQIDTNTGSGADSATGVVVYDTKDFGTDPSIYAEGEPALDQTFRASPVREEVTQEAMGEEQLTGFNYLPAAQLLAATGSGFSFTPPSVTSRPRTLMSADQLGRYTRGRAAQDLQQLLGPNRAIQFPDASGQMQDTTLYDRYRPLLDRGGSYAGGLSRSQLFSLMRQQQAEDARALANQGAGAFTQGQSGAAAAGLARQSGTIADYISLNPDVAADFNTQINEGNLSSDMTLEQFARDHYNNYGLQEMAAGMRTPFSLTGGFTGATGALQTRDLRDTTMGTRFFAEGGPVKKDEAVPVGQEPRDTAQTESASMLQNIMSGAKQIPSTVYEYGRDIATSEAPLSELGEDVSFLGKSIYAGLKEDPVGFTLDMIPVVGEIRSGMDVDKYSDLANQAEAAGNTELANTYRQIVAMAATGVAPLAGMGARAGKRAAISAAEDAIKRGALSDATRILSEAGESNYPLAKDWYGDQNYRETGGRLVYMDPAEYLSSVRPLKMDDVTRENVDELKRHIQQGGELDPLAIYPSGLEDGRHRAIAAQELGLGKVPVLRWDEATSARAMLDDIAETAGTRAVPEVQPTQPVAFSDAYAQEMMTTLPEPVNTDLYKGADVAKSQWLTSPEGQTFNRQIAADPEGMIARYNAIPDTEGGKVLDTDLFRELSPNYLADRTLATEIHEAASALNKGLYQRRLEETAGQKGTWVFTGGGPASGKSSGPAKKMRADADLIYDGSMANFDAMTKRIDDALNSGKNAKLVFIDRAPERAIGLAVGRAMGQVSEFGSGRTIPKDEFVRMHMESRESIKKLAEYYKNHENVEINVIDNNGVQGQEFFKNIEDIPDLDYNESLKRVEEALEEMRSEGEGRISQDIYDGFNRLYREEQAPQPSGERTASQAEQGAAGRNAEQAAQRAEPLGVGVDESLAGGQRLKSYGTEQLDLMDSLAANATAGTRAADALINAPVEAGTKVGIRLNLNSRIPDAPRGLDKLQTLHKNNFNGKALSYVPYATVENGTFNVSQTGRRNIAAKISGMDVPEAKAKFPAMSVDGNYAPDRNVLREGGEIIEVGFNPAAHHLFIDMNTGQAVKSFDVATVVGDRVYAKGVTYHKKSEAPEPVAASDGTELPSNVRYREMSKGGIVDRKEDNRTYI